MTDETRIVLDRALAQGLRIHVISVFREARHEGRLGSVDEDEVQLILPGAPELSPHDSVSIAFSGGPRTYSFLARVLDVEGDRVWVASPEELLSADRRLRPRVAVCSPVEVTVAGVAGGFRLVDLSPTGMRITPGAAPPVDLGERVGALLVAGPHRVEVQAEHRHTAEGVSGFFFPGSVLRGRVRLLPGLAELLGAVGKAG